MDVRKTTAALCALGLVALAARASAAPASTFTAGTFTVSVEGAASEAVAAVEGGDLVGSVGVLGVAADGIPNKRLVGDAVQQPMKIRLRPGSAPNLESWISRALLPEGLEASGAVILHDAGLNPVSQRTFEDAVLRSLALPVLDAASNQPASITVTVLPRRTTYDLASGPKPSLGVKSKEFLASGFRLTIDGLDTSGVAKVEVPPVVQTSGEAGTPSALEVPNLTLSLQASTASGWFDWFQEFVIDGKNGDASERSGRIELLGPDGKKVLAAIVLKGLGIVSLSSERADGWLTKKGAKSASERVKAVLYCESLGYEPSA
jgi:hypothetical protein